MYKMDIERFIYLRLKQIHFSILSLTKDELYHDISYLVRYVDSNYKFDDREKVKELVYDACFALKLLHRDFNRLKRGGENADCTDVT